jgi:signal transduction histidine kinase
MWRGIAKWYRELEDEHLRVLAEPALAARTAPGYRRFVANRLARLTPIERQQLLEFSLNYRGWRSFAAIAKFAAMFSVAGAILHLAVPSIRWIAAIGAVNVIGFSIVAAVIGVWFNYRHINYRNRQLCIALFIAVISGALSLERSLEDALNSFPGGMLIGALAAGIFMLFPLTLIAGMRNRHHEALTVQLQRDAERDRLARELSESQLRLLRAQIEPHFLFNTLGAVQQLAEQGAPHAAELTANLITFLRASLTEMRSDQASLRMEFALVDAYLRVMKARLGERLQFSLDLPDALAGLTVPSMIVLTLAENAIKHGIEPSLRGGAVSVSAQTRDGVACIRVHDTGIGMALQPGSGVGLGNVRHRLQLAHGSAASVTLSEAEQGVVAEILIPLGTAKT